MQRFLSPRDSRVMARRRAVCRSLERSFNRHCRKLHPLDCGVPRCGTCHSDKTPNRAPTRQELRAELAMRESLGLG